MKIFHLSRRLAVVILPIAVSVAVTTAAPPAIADKPAATAGKVPVATIVYRPPLRGAPAARVGGGSRGLAEVLPSIEVLAPDHAGLTLFAQPTLYWYLSRPVQLPIEITLIEERVIEPLLELKLDAAAAGIHDLSLAKLGLNLKPGVQYQWLVAVVPDPRQRSKDILASALIRRVVPDAGLNSRLQRGNPDDRLREYAESGIWYDLIDALSLRIAAQPQNAELRDLRAALLQEEGLQEAAAFDRSRQ